MSAFEQLMQEAKKRKQGDSGAFDSLMAEAKGEKPYGEPIQKNGQYQVGGPVEWRDKVSQLWRGGSDVAKVVGSGVAAEHASGLAGLLDIAFRADPKFSLMGGGQGQDIDATVRRMDNVRDTIQMQPTSDEGRESLQAMGEFMQPVADTMQSARDISGEYVRDKTGSDVLGALAYAGPDAIVEATTGFVGGKAARGIKSVPDMVDDFRINKALVKNAPSATELRQTADSWFKAVDNMGVTIKPDDFTALVEDINTTLRATGADPGVTPKASGVIARLESELDNPVKTLSDLETLRAVAKGAAKSIDKHEAMLGSIAVDKIDDFLENLKPGQLLSGEANAERVGVAYRQARENWGRMRRSEALTEAVEVASNARSGWENGIRNEFSALLKKIDKGKLPGFKEHEIAAMKMVANGTKGSNITRGLGKMGVSIGGGNNWLGSMLTGGFAYSLGGPAAALTAVGAGTAFKRLAERLTRGNAAFADAVVRAGRNGRNIVEAYLKTTPKKKWNAEELSLLLTHQDVDLTGLQNIKIARDAAKLATERRAQLAGILAANEAGRTNE